MERTLFNEAQREMLDVMSRIKSPEELQELKHAISEFYVGKADDTVEQIVNMLRFVESQIVFVIGTTTDVKTYHDFLASEGSTVLFNSTCMCLQVIGATIRKVDDITAGSFFALYPSTSWKQIIEISDIISRECLSVDTELIFDITREELAPLLTDLRRVLADIDNTMQENSKEEEKVRSGSPCQYTVKEMKQRVKKAVEDIERGNCYTTDEVMKSTEWL